MNKKKWLSRQQYIYLFKKELSNENLLAPSEPNASWSVPFFRKVLVSDTSLNKAKHCREACIKFYLRH